MENTDTDGPSPFGRPRRSAMSADELDDLADVEALAQLVEGRFGNTRVAGRLLGVGERGALAACDRK